MTNTVNDIIIIIMLQLLSCMRTLHIFSVYESTLVTATGLGQCSCPPTAVVFCKQTTTMSNACPARQRMLAPFFQAAQRVA